MKQRVFSFDGSEVRKLAVEAPGPLRWATWNKGDGSSLLVGDRGSLFEYRGGAFRAIRSGTTENLRCVELHPDGSKAYACGNDGTILLIDGDAVTPVRSEGREGLRRLGWNHSGSRALIVGNSGAAYVMGSHQELVRVRGAETHLRSVAWHPKDDVAIVAGNCFRDSIGSLTPSPNLFELMGDTLNEVSDVEGSRADLTSASWRPDGSACLVAGFDQTWHTATLLSYSPAGLTDVKWGDGNLFPTACSWNPSGSYALIGTSPLTDQEGPASLYRHDYGRGITKVADLEGFGVSCIAWKDEHMALVACSRHVRAFSA